MKTKTPTNRPRIEDQKHYKKVGRLSPTIAKTIRRKSADIYIDENHVKHIFDRHEKELAKVGLTPLMFVDLVVNNYNRIYKSNNRQSILLVQWNGTPKVAVTELNLAFKNEFYEIKTAFVKTKDTFRNLKLLWKKE